jgi:hypothetical protein
MVTCDMSISVDGFRGRSEPKRRQAVRQRRRGVGALDLEQLGEVSGTDLVTHLRYRVVH